MFRFFHPVTAGVTTAVLALTASQLPAETQGWQNLGHGLAGSAGVPVLAANTPEIGRSLDFSLRSARLRN